MSKVVGLHITVGVSPINGDFSIKNELELVKTALIYADKVNLCSVKTAMFMPLLKLNPIQQFQFIEDIIDDLSPEDKVMFFQIRECYKYIINKKEKLSQEEVFAKTELQKITNLIHRKIAENSKIGGFSQLIGPMKKSQLEIKFYNNNPSKFEPGKLLPQFIDFIGKSINNNTHLLLDSATGSALTNAIQKGYFEVPDIAIQKARHVKLVSNLMQRLPCFEYATLDEALDIKKELSKPLIKFRASIIKYSDNIKTQPWDKNFEYDCQAIFMKEIEPAILEIEDACNSNKYLKRLLSKAIDLSPIGATATFGTFIAQHTNLADVLNSSIPTILTGVGSSTIIALKAAKEWYEENKKINSNQLFFYYKAGQILQKKEKLY